MSKKRRWLIVLGVSVAAFAHVWASGSDERAVREVLGRAAATLSAKGGEDDARRASRLERDLAELFTSDVRVDAAEPFGVAGLAEVAQKAVALARGKHPVLTLSRPEVRIDGSDRASATFRVSVSESQAADLHAPSRAARATLVKTARGWRIESVRVDTEAPSEPEPRP